MGVLGSAEVPLFGVSDFLKQPQEPRLTSQNVKTVDEAVITGADEAVRTGSD